MAHTAAETDRLDLLAAELRDFVLRAKRALDEEMRSYPTPIPRCDAQFNHAYEQRSRLSALLQQIDAVTDGTGDPTMLPGAMAEFASLPLTGDTVEERILRERIGAALARIRPE